MSKKHEQTVKIADPEEVSRYAPGAATMPPSDAVAETPPNEVEALRRETAELRDKLLRAVAEQQNVRTRAAHEQAEAARYANASLVKSLLSSLDDFERLLEHSSDAEVSTLRDGAKLIYDNLKRALAAHRVTEIDGAGVPFDPRIHEAMLQQPSSDHAPGTVTQVLQRGYRLEERVLRPAKVIIASATGGAAVDGDGRETSVGAAS